MAFRIVTSAMVVLMTGGAAAAQQGVPRGPRAGLQVLVRDADGRGLPGIALSVRDTAGKVVATAQTSVDGIAYVRDLTAGSYDVVVVAPDNSQTLSRVRIDRGALVSVELVLPRAAATPGGTAGPPRPPGAATPAAEPAGAPTSVPGSAPRAQDANPVTPAGKPPDEKIFVPMPDRWNVSMPDWDRYHVDGDYPYVGGHWWDPYNRNRLKGDYPLIGQRTFFVFTGVSDTLVDGFNVPTPAVPSSQRPLSEPFFGRGDQYLPVAVIRASLDLFRGDTAFRPVDWRVRVQPAISANYIRTQETGVVNADVGQGRTRFDTHIGLQEAFAEKKLFDVGPSYDFVSVRAGIQELSTDFRGFIAVVEQPGIRVFGTLASSRIEYNAAVFDFLEKDTNSGFNEFSRRREQMAVANVYVQDFLRPGYTTAFSVHYARDSGARHFDTNGFLTRPAPIGAVAAHEIRSVYLGWAGSGHLGPVNLSHAFYQALGTDDFNPIAARKVDINAQMAAVELSIDRGWLRDKAGVFWASGDDNIADSRARGFDSIVDVPVFAGAPFGVWGRTGIRLSGTGTGLVSPLSLLPSLRTNKDEGQQNFVNPGILILFGGTDLALTPRLRAFVNASAMRFQHTAPLEALLFQAPIHRSVGLELDGSAQYRPALSENIALSAGVGLTRLGEGLRDIYSRRYFASVFANLRLQF